MLKNDVTRLNLFMTGTNIDISFWNPFGGSLVCVIRAFDVGYFNIKKNEQIERPVKPVKLVNESPVDK